MILQPARIAQTVTATTYAAARTWSDPYLPALKAAAGRALFTETDLFTDRNLGSDLTLITSGRVEIACRVRGYKYLDGYGDEFTIRDSRRSGAHTELAKILAGYGTHNIYAFAHPFLAGELAAWVVGNLDVFRRWFHGYQRKYGIEPGSLLPEQTDGTRFRAFNLDTLPPDFVIARQVQR